jgi:hypothetical protein
MNGAASNTTLRSTAQVRQAWSKAADALKASVALWRRRALSLALAGALIETLAGQKYLGAATVWLALSGAAVLAFVPFIRTRLLGQSRLQAWVRLRAASESLKRELYLYRTGTEPYHTADRDRELLQQQKRIVEGVADLERYAAPYANLEPAGFGPLTVDAYIEERVRGQIDRFYRPKAAALDRTQKRLANVELVFSFTAVLLGAAAAMWGSLAAWVAVVTTAAGAIIAHVAAERYDSLIVSYLSTARRLEMLFADWTISERTAASAGQLVKDCEAAIQGENQAWIAYWSKDPSS